MEGPKRQCDACRHQETCITYKEAAKDKTKWLFGCTDYEAPFATSRIEDAIRDRIWNAGDFAPMKPEEPKDE